MVDTTRTTKVYDTDGGDRMVVASGGSVDVETGGKMTANGTQAGAISDVPTAGSATAADNAAAINSMLDALRGVGIIAS